VLDVILYITVREKGNKMTKAKVLKDFRSEFWMPLKSVQGDSIAKNEMFWAFVDGLVKSGMVTQSQWQRWANPF